MQLLYTLTAYPPSIGGAQIHHHLLAQQLQHRHSIQVVSHWDQNRTDWLLGTTLRSPSSSRDYVVDNIPAHRLGLSLGRRFVLPPFAAILPIYAGVLPAIAHILESHLAPYAAKADLIHNVRIGREGPAMPPTNPRGNGYSLCANAGSPSPLGRMALPSLPPALQDGRCGNCANSGREDDFDEARRAGRPNYGDRDWASTRANGQSCRFLEEL